MNEELKESMKAFAEEAYSQGRKDAISNIIDGVKGMYDIQNTVDIKELLHELERVLDNEGESK